MPIINGIHFKKTPSPSASHFRAHEQFFLYCIVAGIFIQEACENSLKCARAKTIKIEAVLERVRIEIKVEDDGVGFGAEIRLKLDDMLAYKHFGLACQPDRRAGPCRF